MEPTPHSIMKSDGKLKFELPVIHDNLNGWGPSSLPEQYKDMPYQPFSKGDRLGKVSDWTGSTYQDRRYANKYASQFGVGNQYAYYHEEDESSFQLVDTVKVQKSMYQRGRFRFNQRNMRKDQQRQRQQQQQAQLQVLSKTAKSRERDRQRQVRKLQKQLGARQKFDQKNPIKNRDASVIVRPEWQVIEEMDFPRLSKLSLPGVEEAKDIKRCGGLEFYDKTYDRVTTRNEKKLQRVNRIFHKVTTTDDPIIRQLVKTEGNVFATDAILATLMCCTRSIYSWDIIVQRVGNKLFFDKRDSSEFDLLTVSETSNEPPQDETNSINSPKNLALEATFINHNFSQQVLKTFVKGAEDDKYKFEEKNPFIQEDEAGEVASVGYRYRKWSLDNDIELIVRCEHDAVMHGPNMETQFINIKALNEWDSRFSGGIDWRQKLDTQRGAVLANELKNNSCKLAKWTIQAILASSDQLKFG
ncbi:Eukaryotic translation initiation factor 3 subunit D, variant 2 [Chamberlinius hualienensis]